MSQIGYGWLTCSSMILDLSRILKWENGKSFPLMGEVSLFEERVNRMETVYGYLHPLDSLQNAPLGDGSGFGESR